MTRHPIRLHALLAATFLSACAGETVDLGNDKPSAENQSSLVAYAGTWSGHAEAYTFRDGTDRVRLRIDAAGHGSIEFGASPPLPPPDVNHGYPTSELEIDLGNYFMPGFTYSILEANVEDSRLRMRTNTHLVFKEWCTLFTPVFTPGATLPGLDLPPVPQYLCGPALANIWMTADGCFAGMDAVPIDCGLNNCGAVCECDAERCVVGQGIDIKFDGALEQDGDKLVGTLVKGIDRITLRLTRD